MVAAYTTQEMWDFWVALKALEPSTQLGGTYAFKSGYHSTRLDNQRNWPSDYSIRDAIDKQGPADRAAAIDWTFPDAQNGNYSTIAKYCQRLMASSLDHNDPRLDVLREWYGQTDSDREVEGWDTRYYRAVTSDSSHLWHIHLSFTRAYVGSVQGFHDVLSVLKGETVAQWAGFHTQQQEDDMISGQFPPGFAYDHTGALLDSKLVITIPLEPAKASAIGRLLSGTLSVLGDHSQGAEKVRVAQHGSGGYENPTYLESDRTRSAEWLRDGRDGFSIGRMKRTVDDQNANSPLGWTFIYDIKS